MGKQDNQMRPHAIMFPLPLQGHVIPSVHLAIKLASKGFTITFVNTHSIHHRTTKSQATPTGGDDIFTGARKSGLDIRYTTVSDGFPLDFDRTLNEDQFAEGFLHVFPAHVDELIGNMVRSDTDPPITCLVADTFLVWTSMIAKKYKLVNVSFWTEPALVYTLYYHLDLLKINGHFASHDIREDSIDYIPGVDAIEVKDLASYIKDNDTSSAVARMIFKAFEDARGADFIICNTVQELESEVISALQDKQLVYPIGPILQPGFTKSTVVTSLWSESDCTQWLNTKTGGSVLYVSFGSLATVSKSDILELAHGLIVSKVSFVWVLRAGIVGPGVTDILPVGFEDDIRDGGLVVPWCRQVEVLSHPAIRGFLTHCGWNSILESIWCGIPLLCFPLMADQISNRKLVVDDWKIGLNLCDRKPITRVEVAKNINRLISGKLADELRKNSNAVRMTLVNALSKNGSSEINFNQFINHVKDKITTNLGTSAI
ncbi:Glycosyltransferase [Quillaja saponaria]|uniref:Glycosyltransferase n=1 Tax=Quillaja saponaria TaxID=32244 RepID=A0AAD7VE08_QUISA|nr:Glycosyltransferase [Quillaja saponaria]